MQIQACGVLLGIGLTLCGPLSSVPAQPAEADRVVDRAFVEQQIRDLSHPNYRTRQLARWRLEQYPAQTIDVISEALGEVEYNTGAQLVDLLSALAMHGDVSISILSRETLKVHANRVSSIGRLADNALHAIADLQEEQAIEILTHHQARIGFRNALGFNLNARVARSDELSLWINEDFVGDDQTIEWIQFLKSIETVFLEGPQIDSRHYAAIAQLPNVKNLKLKHVRITNDDMQLLKQFSDMEILEMSYMQLDDNDISLLAELPVSQSLRLYGTDISQAGAEQLAKQLDGIEIYCGKGGYLGVGTDQTNTIVSILTPGSGAQLAGIEIGDELTQINGVPIKTFPDLRTELGKYVAGDKIIVRLSRPTSSNQFTELELPVVLGEDPN